ncbi:MAG: hypothetical protein ACOYON_06505 [Fimbriimonas sp.]
MRRPGLRRLRLRMGNSLPPELRAKVKASANRQDRWARKYGVPLLTVAFQLFIASVLITGCYMAALQLFESGVLSVPTEVREKAGA